MISGYIRKNGIDMKPFSGQTYGSFADFFSRKRDDVNYVPDPNVLISPCDGLLSVYTITGNLEIPMKGSIYTLSDLVPDKETAELFKDGLCLVFRLEESDYHHFCYFDDSLPIVTNYVPGQLHSVQPIAQRYVPVFHLNRRWWSIAETKHFGTAVQIEIGAMLVGGVSFSEKDNWCSRGDEMGCFELAGSTIILILNSDIRNRLFFEETLISAIDEGQEVRVCMGAAIGGLRNEK